MAFTPASFMNAPPHPAPKQEHTNGITEYFKFAAKMAGSEIPTNVGMKLDIAISLSLECFFANKYIPMAPPPCAMIDTDQIP